jgi:hypothetical protein
LNLEPPVQAIIQPQLDEQPIPEAILASLNCIYDNPYKVREARDRFNRLEQGSDLLQMYIARFERLVAEA